jgi:hypothetical protein
MDVERPSRASGTEVKFIENNCNATRNPGGVFFVSACAAVKLIPKEKGKKESAFRGAG